MPNTLVITIMGPDRPGIVAEMAACVAEHGGNWLESRLVHLGGQFAGVLRVEVPTENAEALQSALKSFEKAGLTSIAKAERATLEPFVTHRLVKVDLVGSDRPGILRAVSAALSRHSVNIEELSTERRAAPMSGEPLFQARAAIRLPAESTLPDLRTELEKIAGDLLVDLTVSLPD